MSILVCHFIFYYILYLEEETIGFETYSFILFIKNWLKPSVLLLFIDSFLLILFFASIFISTSDTKSYRNHFDYQYILTNINRLSKSHAHHQFLPHLEQINCACIFPCPVRQTLISPQFYPTNHRHRLCPSGITATGCNAIL